MTSDSRNAISRPAGDELPPIDWVVQSGAVEDVLQVMEARLRRRRVVRRRRLGAVAAVLMVGCVALGFGLRPDRAPALAAAPTATVALPDRRVLPDGSVVEVRSGGELDVAFTPDERRVRLLRGEARFQVMKDVSRPFVVEAAGVLARAVGTAFVVQITREQVEVLVTEGRVQVSAPSTGTEKSAPDARSPLLQAGERVVVSPSPLASDLPPQVSRVSAPQLTERLSWLSPRLEFSGTPLAEAIPLINRYSAVRLTLADPSLEAVRLSGWLRADNIETLWRLLEEDYGLRVEQRGPNEVVLHRGADR